MVRNHRITWTHQSVQDLFEKPFFDLISQAHEIHGRHFDPSRIELCALINIKTGGCPEDCGFCHQSAHFKTGLDREALMDVESVVQKAKKLKHLGVQRCCLGAAWRTPPKKDFPRVIEMIRHVKAIGFETCVTLGFLDQQQANQLKDAGLDYYNHNIETSPEFYANVVSTHSFQDRLTTVQNVSRAKINVCCGGIVGLGESREDRINFLLALSQIKTLPKSIPINRMIRFDKTPLKDVETLDVFEFIRTIAVTRIMFPQSMVRLSGGRKELSESDQALCFYAGANSIFVGDKLLTAQNQSFDSDMFLMKRLNLKPVRPVYLTGETDVSSA